jgi:hypothetical protein
MALPWLAVGKLVLNNLDTIMGVVKPAFTRKRADTLAMQTDLLNQQIAELQAAASGNAEQIRQLAAQVKELVEALAQSATEAASQRAAARRWSYAALTLALVAVGLGTVALLSGCSASPAVSSGMAFESHAGLRLELDVEAITARQ